MWKLFLTLALLFLASSCESSRESGTGGGTPRETARDPESVTQQEHSSRRKLDRDLRGRYSDKSVRRRYNLSKKQLDTVKKDLRKHDPSQATEAAQQPPASQPQTSGR